MIHGFQLGFLSGDGLISSLLTIYHNSYTRVETTGLDSNAYWYGWLRLVVAIVCYSYRLPYFYLGRQSYYVIVTNHQFLVFFMLLILFLYV